MDPFSVTVGVVGLIATSSKIVVSLKDLVDSAQGVNTRIELMISEVELLKRALQSMKTTLEADTLQPFFQSTGHLAEHWANISACLRDGEKMLSDLDSILAGINKSVRVLDSTRKAMRLNSAWEDVESYQQRCRSCRETIQLSLQAALLWGQVSSRQLENASTINLAELTQSIQRLADFVSLRMASLDRRGEAETANIEELSSLRNQRTCVQSSANIVSSTCSLATDDEESVAAASDLHGIFNHQPNQLTLAWTVEMSKLDLAMYADKDVPPLRRPSSVPAISVSTAIEESDSDGEIEAEIVHLHVSKGREALRAGNYEEAERLLSRGIDRVRRSKSRHLSSSMQTEALEELATLYKQQEKWQEAKDTIIQKLGVLSRTATADSTDILQEKLALAKVLLLLDDTVQARLHVRACVKGYRRLGHGGRDGLDNSLQAMVDICRSEGDADGEEEYTMLLSSPDIPCADSQPSPAASQVSQFKTKSTPRSPEDKPAEDLETTSRLLPSPGTTLALWEPLEFQSANLDLSFSEHLTSPITTTTSGFIPGDTVPIPIIATQDMDPSDTPLTRASSDCLRVSEPARSQTDDREAPRHPSRAESVDNLHDLVPAKSLPHQNEFHYSQQNEYSAELEKLDVRPISPMGHGTSLLPPTAFSHHRSVSNPETMNWNKMLNPELPQTDADASDRNSTLFNTPFTRGHSVDGHSSSRHIDADLPRHTGSKLPTLNPRVRALFIGATYCGKTSLITHYTQGAGTLAGTHDATPSLVPHITSCPLPLWPQPVELVLWDSPGPVDENLIPKLVETIAEQIHCVVLCFAVDEPDLISDVDTMWAPQIRSIFPNRPIVLVGTKTDLRTGPYVGKGFAAPMDQPCSRREGLHLQARIGATGYFDCSAKTGEGVLELAREITAQGIQYQHLIGDQSPLKGLWRKGTTWFKRRSNIS